MENFDLEEKEILEACLDDLFTMSGMETRYSIIQIAIKLRLRDGFIQELWEDYWQQYN